MVQLCRGPSKAQSGGDAVDGGTRPSRLANGGGVCVHGQRLLDQPRTHARTGLILQVLISDDTAAETYSQSYSKLVLTLSLP